MGVGKSTSGESHFSSRTKLFWAWSGEHHPLPIGGFSVAAIVIGHIAQIRARSKHRFVGKQLVIAGLGIGYVNLGLALSGLFAM
jgi:hypothetical protein